jgi:hypothetical protein
MSQSDRAGHNQPPRARRASELRTVARFRVIVWEMLFLWHWTPMRRRDLAGLTILRDPFTGLSRPVSYFIGPSRIMLENYDLPISRCGLDRVAHCKDACSDGYRAIASPFRQLAYSASDGASILSSEVPTKESVESSIIVVNLRDHAASWIARSERTSQHASTGTRLVIPGRAERVAPLRRAPSCAAPAHSAPARRSDRCHARISRRAW